MSEHLVLNVLSRISALAEVDVLQCQNLIIALGKYLHVSSAVFRESRFPFYSDVEEVFAGLKVLGLMRNVVIDVSLASDANLQEVTKSYSVFRCFHKWFEVELLAKNLSAVYSVSIFLHRHNDELTVRIVVNFEDAGQPVDAVWQVALVH